MMNAEEIEKLIDQRVAAALAAAGIPRGTLNVGQSKDTGNTSQSRSAEGALGRLTEVRTLIVKREWDEIQDGNPNPSPDKRPRVVKGQDEGPSNTKKYAGRYPYCGRCERHHPGRCRMVCSKCKEIGHKADNCGAPFLKTMAPTPTKYAGKLPWCSRCRRHHKGACNVVCLKCQKAGHKATTCRVSLSTTPVKATPKIPLGYCFKCGKLGHFKNQCPENGNEAMTASGGALVIKAEETCQDPDITTGEFHPNV